MGLPTYRRPEMLAVCLESLTRLRVPQGVRLAVLVVDNDPAASARALVTGFADRLDVHYVTESQRGLSAVRNRLLDEALALGATWFAGIDDDESAEPDWLLELWATREAHAADIASGPVVRLPWGEAVTQAAIDAWPNWQQGSEPRHIGACNVLFRLACLGTPPLRFDRRLDFVGGEDQEFFERLRSRGASAVWAARAVTIEWLPKSRQTLAYRLRRAYTDGISGAVRSQIKRGAVRGRLYLVVRMLDKLVGALTAWARLPLDPQGAGVKGLARLCTAGGYLAGSLGWRQGRYRQTDGL